MIKERLMARGSVLVLALAMALAAMAPSARADVSWLDLLSDPDNASLNRQFVAERLAEGDMPAALSAIERLLILRPTDIPFRILRAEILVNLGNDTLARGELEALARLPLLPSQKDRVERLQDAIDSRGKRWRTTASLSLGVRGSDNANNYPSSGLLDFKLSAATPASTRQYESFGGATKSMYEVAGVASTVVATTYEMPNQDRDSLTAGISHAETRGQDYEYLTSSTTTAFAGASLRVGDISMRPTLRLTEMHNRTDSSSTIASASLTTGYGLPFKIQSHATAEYSIVNRIPSRKFSTANQNDGHSRSFKLGLSRSILSRLTLFGEASYTSFNPMETRFAAATIPYTQAKANQNRRQIGTVGVLFTATPHIRVRASVIASDSKYLNIDPTSKKYRRDTQTRSTIGMQIAGQAVNRKLEKFSLGISASKTRNESNIRQYDYRRSDASLTVNYQLAN